MKLSPPSLLLLLFVIVLAATTEANDGPYQVFYHWAKKEANDVLRFQPGTKDELLAGTHPLKKAAMGKDDLVEIWIPRDVYEKEKFKTLFPAPESLKISSLDSSFLIRPFFGVSFSDTELESLIKQIPLPGRKKFQHLVKERKNHFLWVEISDQIYCFERDEDAGTFIHEGNKFRKSEFSFCPEKTLLTVAAGTPQDLQKANQEEARQKEIIASQERNFECRHDMKVLSEVVAQDLQNLLDHLSPETPGEARNLAGNFQEQWRKRNLLRTEAYLVTTPVDHEKLMEYKTQVLQNAQIAIQLKTQEFSRILNKRTENIKNENDPDTAHQKILSLKSDFMKEIKKFEEKSLKEAEKLISTKVQAKPSWFSEDAALTGFFNPWGLDLLRYGDLQKKEQVLSQGLQQLKLEIESYQKVINDFCTLPLSLATEKEMVSIKHLIVQGREKLKSVLREKALLVKKGKLSRQKAFQEISDYKERVSSNLKDHLKGFVRSL